MKSIKQREMIKIEKRIVEIDKKGLIKELKDFVTLLKKHNSNLIGINYTNIASHFGIKLKLTDFYLLSEKLELKVHSGKFWYIKEILNLKEDEDA